MSPSQLARDAKIRCALAREAHAAAPTWFGLARRLWRTSVEVPQSSIPKGSFDLQPLIWGGPN